MRERVSQPVRQGGRAAAATDRVTIKEARVLASQRQGPTVCTGSSRGISRDVTIGLKTHIGHNIGLPGPERGGVETWFPGERCVENPYTGLAGWEPASPTLPTVAWPWQARRREPGSHQSNIHTHVLLLTLYSVARRQRAIG